MTAQRPVSLLLALLSFAAILFALVAAKCETNTEFESFVQENCADNVDNDGDNIVDCNDRDCDLACAVQVVIFPVAAITTDSLKISGTHENAAAIALTVTPNGTVGTVDVQPAGTWEAMVKQLNTAQAYTVRAIATSAKDRKDTATVTFEKRN